MPAGSPHRLPVAALMKSLSFESSPVIYSHLAVYHHFIFDFVSYFFGSVVFLSILRMTHGAICSCNLTYNTYLNTCENWKTMKLCLVCCLCEALINIVLGDKLPEKTVPCDNRGFSIISLALVIVYFTLL